MRVAAKSCSSPQTEPGGGPDIWQDLVLAANSSAPGNILTPTERELWFLSSSQPVFCAQPHLFLPGIFSILELSEAISQGCLDHFDGLGLLDPLTALVVTRQLGQPDNTKRANVGAQGSRDCRGDNERLCVQRHLKCVQCSYF